MQIDLSNIDLTFYVKKKLDSTYQDNYLNYRMNKF